MKISQVNRIIPPRKVQAEKLAAIYYRAGAELQRQDYTRRAHSVHMCCDTIVVQGGDVVRQWRCKDKLCPICCTYHARQVAANARRVLDEVTDKYVPYFLTLTQLNCSGAELPARVGDMLAAWRSISNGLRSQRRYVAGYARTVEITISKKYGDYHPHIHVLLLMRRDAPREMLRPRLWSELWRKYMGAERYQSVAPIVHISRIRPNASKNLPTVAAAAAEVAKYTAKSMGILQRPDNYTRILDIDTAIRGRQLRAYGGEWREIRRRLNVDDTKESACDAVYVAELPIEVWRWSGADYRRM